MKGFLNFHPDNHQRIVYDFFSISDLALLGKCLLMLGILFCRTIPLLLDEI